MTEISDNGPTRGTTWGFRFLLIRPGIMISSLLVETIDHVIFLAAPMRWPE